MLPLTQYVFNTEAHALPIRGTAAERSDAAWHGPPPQPPGGPPTDSAICPLDSPLPAAGNTSAAGAPLGFAGAGAQAAAAANALSGGNPALSKTRIKATLSWLGAP